MNHNNNNPVHRPPFSSPIFSFLLPASASSSDGHCILEDCYHLSKSERSEKSAKFEKSEKSAKSEKSEKSAKSERNDLGHGCDAERT